MISLSAIRRFYPSINEHRIVEEEVHRLLSETIDEHYIRTGTDRLSAVNYVRKNFFSILFLNIYRALDVPYSRRIMYGIINHSIRGIVTGTDNILDDEYKELLPLRFPEGATRFKSVMHILLFDRFLYRILDEAVKDGLISTAGKHEVQQRIFDAMVPIGEEEASEENGVSGILPPSEILSSVHMHKGGNLLRLAFVAPRILEEDLAVELGQVDRGIYSIGMALQVIDDLTDFSIDIMKRHHNYLVSSIYFEGSPLEKTKLAHLLDGRTAPPAQIEKDYAQSVSRVMERAVGEALAGFNSLYETGYGITRVQAMGIIRYLFRLRGVKNLLTLLPEHCGTTLSTT